MYSLARTIDATVEPVGLQQLKTHARIDTDADDTVLLAYITAARQYCEQITGRAFLQQTWRLSHEGFPHYGWGRSIPSFRPSEAPFRIWRTPEILLPRPKLIGIVSVQYLDVTGTLQTLDPAQYACNVDGEPAMILPAIGCWWPATLWRSGAVQITYTAGYGNTPAAVPGPIQIAILQIAAHWYENREATILPDAGSGLVTIPFGVAEMLQAYTLDAFTFEF